MKGSRKNILDKFTDKLSDNIYRYKYKQLEEDFSRIASNDFNECIGIQQKKYLEECFPIVKGHIEDNRKKVTSLSNQIDNIDYQKKEEYYKRFSDRQFNNNFKDEVTGIGNHMMNMLRHNCFRGRLNDLHSAKYTKGIGNSKQFQISNWVYQKNDEFERGYARNDYSNREIDEKMKSHKEDLIEELNKTKSSLKKNKRLIGHIEATIEKLDIIDETDFYNSLQIDNEGIFIPVEIILGFFPPWEQPPQWYSKLIKKIGGENHP